MAIRSYLNWETYKSLLIFTGTIKKYLKDIITKDYIYLQSFIWIIGS